MAQTFEFPIPDGNEVEARQKNLINMIMALKLPKGSRILDIGGCEYEAYCKHMGYEYVSLNLEDPQKSGTGGYHVSEKTIKYNGRDLPFSKDTSFDLILLNFVLHHAAENTLPLLKQIGDLSKGYIIIGEDLSELGYEENWHKRNYEHQPGGVYRSDYEWKELFRLYGLSLLAQGIIRRKSDLIKDKIYRCLYLLKARLGTP